MVSSSKSSSNVPSSSVSSSVSPSSSSSSSDEETYGFDVLLVNVTWLVSCCLMTQYFILMAYNIRLLAIVEYGTVIHEFNPYFHYRAAEYLYHNGIKKFFTWYDYKSWYPIGRPIGTTIYPGVQLTAVFIKKYIFKDSMTLNDICCYMPAWFGVISSCLVGLITYECTLQCNTETSFVEVLKRLGRNNSNDDSDDNDDDDVPFLSRWRKLANKSRTARTHIGSINGNTYKKNRKKKMAGKYYSHGMIPSNQNSNYRHANNMIGNSSSSSSPPPSSEEDDHNDHEEENLLLNLSSPATESAIFAMGIMGIVPAHLTRTIGGGFDSECIALSAMCLTFYLWVRSLRAKDDSSHFYGIVAGVSYLYVAMAWEGYIFVLNMIGLHAVVLVLLGRFSTKVYLSFSTFYAVGTILAINVPVIGMAPLKSLEQIPTLFVFIAYQILQFCEVTIARNNYDKSEAWRFRKRVYGGATLLIIVFFSVILQSGYFGPISLKVRRILFLQQAETGNPLIDLGPELQGADLFRSYFRYLHHLCTGALIGFIFTLVHFGDAASFAVTYALTALFFSLRWVRLMVLIGPAASILGGIACGRTLSWSLLQLWEYDESTNNESGSESNSSNSDAKRKKKTGRKAHSDSSSSDETVNKSQSRHGTTGKRILASIFIFILSFFAASFQSYSLHLSRALSNPSIVSHGQRNDGIVMRLDDYRESYWWLRDNTPDDSRILAWWDYGYHITAMANRTTIADGNTWNHEHVALLGKIMTTTQEEGYNIARHLADYVLIWAGGGTDDLAKSPHLARLANSVYNDQCPGDLTCSEFRFLDRNRTPSPMMKESLLYKLHRHEIDEDANLDLSKFEEVYRSKFGKVRIYKILNIDEKSKSWVEDPQNRICDEPGSWLCRGQYPPALNDALAHKNLSTLGHISGKETYTEHNLNNGQNKLVDRVNTKQGSNSQRDKARQRNDNEQMNLSKAHIEAVNAVWKDTKETTLLFRVITSGKVSDLKKMIKANPVVGHVRSSDGRGPMWWAFEHRKQDMVKTLMQNGVSHSERDKDGLTPVDLLDLGYVN